MLKRSRRTARLLTALVGMLTFSLALGIRDARGFTLSNPDSWPFIPIPEAATDPFNGTTLGFLPVFLQLDGSQQIKNIIAPDINYNTILGAGGNFRYLAYPSADTQWYVIAGGSQEKAASVEVDAATGLERKRWWTLEGHLLYQRDPTERFFGLGNNSSYNNQTNYSLEQLYVDLIFGVNITQHLQVALRERPRFVRIHQGALSSLPYTGTDFPTLKGLNGGSEVMNQLVGSYDTRDSITVPTSGGLVALFAGVADRAFMSSSSYTTFAADLRHYFPLTPRITLAGQLYTRYVPAGNETPFWAMSWLGGDGPGESSLLDLPVSDEQTWRGAGAGRFIDNNMFDANLEVRTRVYERELFNTHGILELAPFVDIGRVYHNVSTVPFENLHPAGGMGFRAIALPFVVAYIDVGYGGSGGSAIFSGINYPF